MKDWQVILLRIMIKRIGMFVVNENKCYKLFYDEKVVMRREAIELMAGWKWLNGERMREGKIKKRMNEVVGEKH